TTSPTCSTSRAASTPTLSSMSTAPSARSSWARSATSRVSSRRGSSERVVMAARKKPGSPDTTKLEAVRSRIDSVDEQIHRLISERAKLAQLVGISKSRDGHTVDFYRPEREAQVLRRARERNRGPLRDEEVVRLFREIMSACLAQQEPLKVAYLGPEATFSQTAVLTHFGHSVRALPL